MGNTEFYLFVYDIGNPKTINKVVKRLNRVNSLRIQDSVFEVRGDISDIEKLIAAVERLINKETDKIAVIPICSDDYSNIDFIGVQSFHPCEIPSFMVL